MNSNYSEVLKDMLAAFVGSAACVYTGQPFDTVKVRLQVGNSTEFKGALQCFRTTVQLEGVRALWKGSTPALIGALSENGVAFAINGLLKRLDFTGAGANSFVQPFINGGITGFFTAFVLCPCDVIKCRTQMSRMSGVDTTSRQIFLSTFRNQGFRGLYTGLSAQIMRDIPFYSSFFGSYELLVRWMKANTDMPEYVDFTSPY